MFNTIKKIILILALMCMIVLPVFGQSGTYTSHNLFYLPKYGAYGITEYNTYNEYMEIADNQIWDNKTSVDSIDLSLYYLKTEINTQGKMETIWSVTLATDTELAALTYSDVGAEQADAGLTSLAGLTYVEDSLIKFTANDTYAVRTLAEVKTDLAYQLSDMSDVGVTTPTDKYVLIADGDSWESRALVEADISDLGTYLEDITGESIFDLSDVTADPNADKYAKWDDDPGELIWVDASGYTNLTSFVDQTAWRLFYSNTAGDVVELALGADGEYLMSNGAAVAPTFETPAGGGDMLKATYDIDEDGDVDVAGGGTEKSSWTQYCIPYLSTTTAFGEIPIGTAEYALTVAAGATGYDWTLFDLSLYYLKTEIDTQGEVETIWGDTLMNDLEDDTDPDLGGELDAGAHTIGFTLQSITGDDGTTTIDWQLGNKFKFTFGAQNETFTFTAPTNPCTLMLTLIQDATGSRTVTWPETVKWPGGTAPTLTTTANARDKIALDWDGTQYDGVASLDFK